MAEEKLTNEKIVPINEVIFGVQLKFTPGITPEQENALEKLFEDPKLWAESKEKITEKIHERIPLSTAVTIGRPVKPTGGGT